MTQICSGFASSRFEPSDSLDDFPTPPWAGRALIEHVFRRPWNGRWCAPTRGRSLWEPAVNRGFLLRGLAPYFDKVRGTDVFDYGIGAKKLDYLNPPPQAVDFVITNPPFNLAHAFISKALDEVRIGCAFFVRTSFLEGVNRYESLWSRTPPSFVAHFSERVPLVKGRCDPEASTMTSYCWIAWVRGCEPQPTMWIPPCRRGLERPGDYDTGWRLSDA